MQVLADPRPRALRARWVLHRVNSFGLFATSGILISESNLWESLRCVEATRTGDKGLSPGPETSSSCDRLAESG